MPPDSRLTWIPSSLTTRHGCAFWRSSVFWIRRSEAVVSRLRKNLTWASAQWLLRMETNIRAPHRCWSIAMR
ncbi:unnamed protein product [Dibothriocephalus latus]|uniref:Uncharacterized protein n=1 Tax=Dibothriocephalus latus TaxID=60516 RepID=A0A3P6QN61_DIBLA|nr:unnamed protein product [Dibothriocephalus latus]